MLAKVLLSALACCGCGTTTTARRNLPPLETVPRVELNRYVGEWYEIAAYPQKFQRGCTGTRARYSLRSDGDIDVVNRCRIGTLEGKEKVAQGRARVVDRTTNAKLEVSFFRPFWGDYWIIALDADYQYAAVGHPSRDYLWILSRTPTMDAATYEALLSELGAKGYELDRLKQTLQPPAPRAASLDPT